MPRIPTTLITVGASIRPQAQPSAVVVTQITWVYDRLTRARQDFFSVRFMELIAARTPYPDLAYRLKQIVDNLHLQLAQYKGRVILYADVTGLGQPVVSLIQARVDPLVPCYVTANDRRTETDARVTVGKAWLVARLQTLFQGGRISLPRTAANKVLVEELLTYDLDPSPADNELAGSFTVGTQDPMLTALALACQGIPEAEQSGEEFMEYLRRRAMRGPDPRQASRTWLREWHGKSAVRPIDPLTGQMLEAPA